MPWLEDREEEQRQALADRRELKKQFHAIDREFRSMCGDSRLLDSPYTDKQRDDNDERRQKILQSRLELMRRLRLSKRTIRWYVHKMICIYII
jgi:hypothetical protein